MANKATDIKTFKGGMNKDLDYSVLPNDVYVHAENFKLIANDSGNGFILENSEGNAFEFDPTSISGLSGFKIAGYSYIQPYLILFMTENEVGITPGNNSCIVRLTIDRDEIQDYNVIYTDSSSLGYLNLSLSYPIKATCYYETDDIIKVYWVDGYNEDRFCNIMDSNLSTQTSDMFSIIPDFENISSIPYGDKDVRVEFINLINGDIKASKSQYTYQYYNVNGSSTAYAPLSREILFPIGDPNSNNPYYYKGGEEGEDIHRGSKLKINIPSTKTFDGIRVLALDYNTINSIPTVRVFLEHTFDSNDTSTEFYVRDIGNTIDEIVYEDFLLKGSTNYTSTDLEIKDNILFKSNVKESTFDVEFDARAYRHNSSGVARLYESDLTTYIEVDDGNASYLDYDEVPDNHDCINLFNSPDYETNSSYQYKYQANGSTLGAQGDNIVIGYSTTGLIIDNTGVSGNNKASFDSDNGDNPTSPYNAAYRASFQRHEVYRIGIVFYNEKFQASSVKWSCDLKMPQHSDIDGSSDYAFSDKVVDGCQANVLGLSITLSNFPTDAYAWQIVCAKRNIDDRSVLANGIIQTPVDDTIEKYPKESVLTTQGSLADSNYYPNANIFISPEISFNRNLTFESTSFLQYNGAFGYNSSNNSETVSGASYWRLHKLDDFFPNSSSYLTSGHQVDLTDFKIVSQLTSDDNTVIVGTINYLNYAGGATGVSGSGFYGTVGVGTSSSTFSSLNGNDYVIYASYRRNIFESQYGGLSYYDRQRTQYYGISETRYANDTITTYEGDINISMFYFIHNSLNPDDTSNSQYASNIFPVETIICNNLRNDNYIIQNQNQILQREISGTYEATISGTDLKYVQDKNAYSYNSVYSLFRAGTVYYDEYETQNNQTYFPTRVINSDTKEIGELEDSFTTFRSNNFIDLNGKYGSVNNLLNFKNQLYFWQDNGFGILSVNQRSLITDNNPGTLALGTGSILDRYDYISNTTGNVNPYGIINSNKFIYWVDNYKNEIVTFQGSESFLSKTSGIQTWINDNGYLGYVKGIYDYKYNDVIFTLTFDRILTATQHVGDFPYAYSLNDESGLLQDGTEYNCIIRARHNEESSSTNKYNTISYSSGLSAWILGNNPYGETNSIYYVTIIDDPINTYTLTYSEPLGKFVSFNSFEPNRYFKLATTYLTTSDNESIYKHNSGNRCQYYGTYYDSIITSVFNKDYPYTKVFDVVKWVSESEKNNINYFKDTFDKVEFYNNYQHTGDRELYYQGDTEPITRPTPITRRERTWSLQVPRDIVNDEVEDNPNIFSSSNWDETTGRNTRIRDKYMVTSFTYENNSDNNTFSVPFISGVYRRSYR